MTAYRNYARRPAGLSRVWLPEGNGNAVKPDWNRYLATPIRANGIAATLPGLKRISDSEEQSGGCPSWHAAAFETAKISRENPSRGFIGDEPFDARDGRSTPRMVGLLEAPAT